MQESSGLSRRALGLCCWRKHGYWFDLRCRARAGLEPAKPARDAARALGNCIARNQDPDSFVIGQFYGSARAFIGSLCVTVAVAR